MSASAPDWGALLQGALLGPLQGACRRLVESQQQVATMRLVDRLDEQALLEDLLETSKPDLPRDCADLHYLLAAPFRYPPLPHGSRFGGRFARGCFYAGLTTRTALLESAYYRLLFWHGMESAPATSLRSQHTLFSVRYATRCGARLQAPPFSDHEERLRDPVSYAATQALGEALREAGAQAAEYVSARDPEAGLNVVLFHPGALADRAPEWQQPWLCETTATQVLFRSRMQADIHRFDLALFLVDGVLPLPA